MRALWLVERACFIRVFKMFREMRALWLVRTSSLYFHKARALRYTSALLIYNKRSLRHRYARAQWKATSVTAAEFYGAAIPSNLHFPVTTAVVQW